MSPAAVFVSVMLSLAPAPSSPQTCSLPGLWLGQDRNADAVGMWLEFAPDGSVVRAHGRMVDGEYQMRGDTLTLHTRAAVSQGGGVPVRGDLIQKVTVKIAGGEMSRKAEAAVFEVAREEGAPDRRGRRSSTNPTVSTAPIPAIADLAETKLARVAEGDGADTLSGVWAWKNKTGRPVIERFAGKRHFVTMEPAAAQKGTFTLEDSKLSVTADGATTAVTVTCTPNDLVLEVGGGKLRFVKFQ